MAFIERQARKLIELVGDHAPSAAAAVVIAELFYKFHSFTLECVAFLATWYVLDQIIAVPYQAARRRFVQHGSQ